MTLDSDEEKSSLRNKISDFEIEDDEYEEKKVKASNKKGKSSKKKEK